MVRILIRLWWSVSVRKEYLEDILEGDRDGLIGSERKYGGMLGFDTVNLVLLIDLRNH